MITITGKDAEVKVTKTQSKSCHDVGHEGSKLLVLLCSILSNDIKNSREHDDENWEEEHEDFEVVHHIDDHGDDVTEAHPDSHKEEGLHQRNKHNSHHRNLWPDLPCAVLPLKVQVAVSQENIQQIKVVPGVKEIFKALLEKLSAIVEERVQEANAEHDQNLLVSFGFCFGLQESLVDVVEQGTHVSDMEEKSNGVLTEGKHLPLVVNQIFDQLCLEDGELLRVGNGIGESSLDLTDHWQKIGFVLDLEDFVLVLVKFTSQL